MKTREGSPSFLDGANLFHPGKCRQENAARILDRAFDLLGKDVAAVHGKDVKEGEGLEFTWCGNGFVDFDRMLFNLDQSWGRS